MARLYAWVVVGIILLTLVGVGLNAAGLMWYEPWRRNRETEITRNTNQYVTTQQDALMNSYQRYIDPVATDAQKKAAVIDMCSSANKIDAQYVLEPAKPIMRQAGCWTGGL